MGDQARRVAPRAAYLRARRLACRVSVSVLISLVLLIIGPAPHAIGAGHSSCGGAIPAVANGAASERISIARSEAAVGTLEQVVGTHWPFGAEISITIEYLIDGAYVDASEQPASVPVGINDTFSTPAFRLPPPACNLAAVPGTQGRIVASALDPLGAGEIEMAIYLPITLVAAPSLSVTPVPSQVIAGATSVPVQGAGWGAGTSVSVALGQQEQSNDNPTLVDVLPNAIPVQVTAGDDGTFRARVLVPASLRWGTTVQVIASANTTTYGDVALLDASFAVPLFPPHAPSIALGRVTGNPGDLLTVAGEHWWPGDSVRLEVCEYAPYTPSNQSNQPLGTAVIGPAGTFAKQVHLPRNLGSLPHSAILAFTPDYDPTNTPFFLQTAQFGVRANAQPLAPVSPVVTRPPLQFDLGALLGLIMAVLVALILAEPLASHLKAHVRNR